VAGCAACARAERDEAFLTSSWLDAAGHHIPAGASRAVVIGRFGRLGTRGHPNQMSQAVSRANVQHARTEVVEVCERPELP
jgi:hypothetical protein